MHISVKMNLPLKLYIVIFIVCLSDIHCTRTKRISTTTKYEYMYLDENGISTSGSTFITFQVQACNDVHIALKSKVKEQPIEIVLGGWRNTRSCIRLAPQDQCLVTNVGAVVDCKEYRSFTVYWGDRHILVERGNTTASKSSIMLNIPLDYYLDDVKVGISTGFGSSGSWIIEDIHCTRKSLISTTTKYGYMYLDEYGISTNSLSFITFHVQACSDAHVALKFQSKEQPIEIVISGWKNTQSCIRLTPQDNCSVTTFGAMLDCAENRIFTVDWGGAQIFVMKGNRTAEMSNIFLRLPLKVSISDVKVGISTGYGFSGQWMFEDNNCLQPTCISTSTTYGYMYLDRYGISTSGSTFISFQVQACSDAHIALSSPKTGEPIEIVISGWNNTQSCIRLTPQSLCSATTLGAVLNCNEYRSFTVYWRDGQILVKKGNTTAEKSNIFLSLPLNYNLDDINVGISTGFGFSGRWMFEDEPARVTSRTTKSPMFVTPSIVLIVTSVGAVVILAIIVGVIMSLKICKKTEKSPSTQPKDCNGADFEPERHHRLGTLSDHLYDSITDTTVHTYQALH